MRKLTNMMWRGMGESMVLSLLLFAIIVYVLDDNGSVRPFSSWVEWAGNGLLLLGLVTVIGAMFGYWQSVRIARRLEVLRESMLHLEKGNLSRSIPALGEDEIGRLGEHLSVIRERWEEQVTSLQRLSTNNAQLAEKARLSAVVEERQRLARELHDAVSQQLFAISMTATAVGRTLDKDFEKARRQIHLIEEMASVAQSEMRALLLHLRPVHLEGKRLAQGLVELLQELKAKVPFAIFWDIDPHILLPKGIEDHLFRIVQEVLSNTLRHSRAERLDVTLQAVGDAIRLSVRDNGIGFDLDESKHTSYGLVSMKERVNEIGGAIQIITSPGKGTRIEIRVPVMTEAEADEERGERRGEVRAETGGVSNGDDGDRENADQSAARRRS